MTHLGVCGRYYQGPPQQGLLDVDSPPKLEQEGNLHQTLVSCMYLKERGRLRLGHWENKWFLSFHTRPLTHNAPEMPLKYKTGAKKKSCLFLIMSDENTLVVIEVICLFFWKWMFISLYTRCVMYSEVRNKFTCVWSCPELVLLGLKLVRIELGTRTAIMN